MRHMDKILHLAAGAFCAAVGLYAAGPTAGMALAVLAGLAREVWNGLQQQGGRASGWDFIATVAGGAGVVVWCS